ncbi:MAG: hypothetical protein ACI9HK_003256 [Pirellulaceae bacterium]|jgi:hypothetical protein
MLQHCVEQIRERWTGWFVFIILVMDLFVSHENTYHRLANDPKAKYGRKPIIRSTSWRQTNASRYVRQFQSRRSLLAWKVYGKRMHGWANEDHPTESTPGDVSTLPEGANPNDADIDFIGTIMPPPDSGLPHLTATEKLTIARWIDLGCPISRNEQGYQELGWFLDELRPTLAISSPRAGKDAKVDGIAIGMHDYSSGLAEGSLHVDADFEIDGVPAGENLANRFEKTQAGIWQWRYDSPIAKLAKGRLIISVKDRQGNVSGLALRKLVRLTSRVATTA